MKITKLSFIKKLIAYVLFISIVVRFVYCQLTKNLQTENQFQEFRYFSLAGFIGFLIALGMDRMFHLPNLTMAVIWLLLFVIAELLEKAFNFSKRFRV